MELRNWESVELDKAIVKTGLLRKSKVKPRILKSEKYNHKFSVSYLNHAAEDIYRLEKCGYGSDSG